MPKKYPRPLDAIKGFSWAGKYAESEVDTEDTMIETKRKTEWDRVETG